MPPDKTSTTRRLLRKEDYNDGVLGSENMSFALTFDTLAYTKRLKEADVPVQQAEAHAEALRAVLDTPEVASKTDLRVLETRTDSKFDLLRKDIDLVRSDLSKDIDFVYRELRKDIDLVRSELIGTLGGELKLHRWILGVLAAGMGLAMTGIVSLILKA